MAHYYAERKSETERRLNPWKIRFVNTVFNEQLIQDVSRQISRRYTSITQIFCRPIEESFLTREKVEWWIN